MQKYDAKKLKRALYKPNETFIYISENYGNSPRLPAHMRCAAHTLNLVATADADQALKNPLFEKRYVSAMSKCRALWNKQNQSVHAAEVIKKAFGRKFVTPNQTRWNSVYDSVQCLLDIIKDDLKEFNKVVHEHPIKLQKFAQSDIDFLKQYMKVVEPVAEGLDKLQSEKDAYMGCFLPIICLITYDLNSKLDDDDYQLVLPLTQALLNGINKRFENEKKNLKYQLAAAFHPKFRVDWMSEFMGSEIVDNVVKHMKALVLQEIKTLNTNNNVQEVLQSEQQQQQERSPEDANSKGKSWLSRVTAKGTKNTGDEALKKKANAIVEAWIGSASEQENFHDSVFMGEKSLINMFIKYNTGIPSSAGVERMFSVGKLILRDNRSRLSDINFEKLMFMKGNIDIGS